MRNSALLLLVALTLGACRNFDAAAPEGFAAFDDRRGPFRAVSADGIMYRVRSEANEPAAELKFWKEALKKRMADAGYAFIADDELNGALPGYLLELAAPVGEQDYSFLVAIFVRGDHILIAEASGEVSRFTGRRDAVIAAMGKVK